MFRLGTVQTASIGASSAAVTNAFGNGIRAVRLIATGNCHVVFAVTPTATSSDTYLAAGREEYFVVMEGEKVAVIQDGAATGTLYCTEVSR